MAGYESEENLKQFNALQSPPSKNHNTIDYSVLIYIPNVIGYIRLSFLVLAFFLLPTSPALFITFYSISITLDGFDGYAARKLQQCSVFGAWFDVVIDNVSRGLLWTHLHPMLYLIAAVEWTAFVCNHSFGSDWRDKLTQGHQIRPPKLVGLAMANNFRNPWGIWTIAGLHVLPVWLLGLQYDVFTSHLWFIPYCIKIGGLIILGLGRLLCLFVELWSIWIHITLMLVNVSGKA